ncbi:hypothetical protein [Nocardia tengchongensis]|uniref:hypothetical protein n=1 Tax=Nocardia tengchongensis TaxID=2055889 RepID=UPI00367580DC
MSALIPNLHLHVELGPLVLDYRGHADQIGEVATELAAAGLAAVSVDDRVTAEMPWLPCSRLWDSRVGAIGSRWLSMISES